MKRLLPILFFIGFACLGFSQDETDPFDFEVSKPKRTQLIDKRLRFGYGIQVPIATSSTFQTTPNTLYTDDSWLTKNPVQVIDIGLMLGFRENWTLGLTMTSQRLGSSREKFEYQPSADAVFYYPLKTIYSTIGRVYGNTVYAERRLYSSYNDRFRVFSRVDVGFNRYSAVAKIQYKDENDTCNCNRVLMKSRSGTTVLAADLSVGVQYIRQFLGVKFSVGYRIQTPGKLIMKDELENWNYNFNEEEYDYNGDPDKKLFSINRPAAERAEIMHQRLYAQFSLLMVLGKRSYPFR
ncbi:MAG: hypothetical protein A3D31_18585 [Candidatus Fluviicola riflensis]|nr:MAG: hypothetical protein CHH17_03575 [Candidatus Fluviicola riflensis]OGS76455.1 MAG: hypothetical protein A3D31_18585 [Candidatus Fluviicola riflensis]OGS82749.1 MAG: hypothetical protein A2724_13410 [Fluviicola sp. RIFCSPHIGHO2_01_FULL_43_53]OGS89048.1 MAG: hypothetical protein A3E30_17070 [Fluviicola sp. RIFCSPHIGHO2_12_FULL_43_24]